MLRNVENVQFLILGLKDLTLNPWAPKSYPVRYAFVGVFAVRTLVGTWFAQ